jgi:type IV secretory pathway VirB10-like protein
MATTFTRWVVRPGTDVRRLTFVLGGLVVLGVITAIAIVLAHDHPGPQEHKVSYADIAAHSTADAGLTDIAVVRPLAPDARPLAVAPPPTPAAAPSAAAPTPTEAPKTVAEIDTECQAYETAHKWDAVAQCADKLKPLDLKRAKELATRAQEETRSSPHIQRTEAALHDNDLKRAKTELDQVWPQSVACAELKRKYDLAEAKEIDALATELESVKDATCVAYNQLRAKAWAVNPPRVISEASRRVPCTTPRSATPKRSRRRR